MSMLGKELVQSMSEAPAKGKRACSRTHKIATKPDEVQEVCNQSVLSQDQLGDAVGVSASTLRNGLAQGIH